FGNWRRLMSRQATPASAEARPGYPGARRGGNGLRSGPAARGQQEVPLSAGSHRRAGPQPGFRPPSNTSDKVLFYLPVTKAWLRQLVLGLVLICHSSTRGVVELLRDLFDFRISLGTVHNIVHSPVAQARRINQQYDLSSIHIGLLDEIFQARDPVLVGVDAQSTFCFWLSPEEHRDADTWGVRLLELVDRGFAPQATIADFASGLRAGHQEALPGRLCRGDVFHALYD